MRKKYFGFRIAIVLLTVWFLIVCIDLGLVFIAYKKPLFARHDSSIEEIEESKYIGLGYYFNIEGHFDDCDCILQGVVVAEAVVLGIPMHNMKREVNP